MPKISAGLLPYRWRDGRLEVFLVHPGGPFWAKKDEHAWSIPKGEAGPGEDLLAAARREFTEETGLTCAAPALGLTPIRQKGGKVVHAWAVEADLDPGQVRSNRFELEWPPRSGRTQSFPEVDRAAWIDLAEARRKVHKGQVELLDELAGRVGDQPG
jgi:predicted NUDIX family NTP pyrophosphohydrolase